MTAKHAVSTGHPKSRRNDGMTERPTEQQLKQSNSKAKMCNGRRHVPLCPHSLLRLTS